MRCLAIFGPGIINQLKRNWMLKKLAHFGVIVFSMLYALAVSAQSSSDDGLLSAEELAWVRDNPVVTSTNEMEWAPLDFVRDGEAIGYSIDYLNLVAEKVGLKIKYVNGYSWEELLTKLKNKEIDMAQSIIQTPERIEYLNFTSPYLDLPMVYFGREGASRISRIEDLIGKRIGVVIGAVPAIIYEKDHPELHIVKFESTFQALKALSAGSIDVHADILPVSRYMISTNLLPGIEVIGDKFFPITENADYIRLAARKDWPILVEILEKGMAAITEEELIAITNKWQTEQTSINYSNLGLTIEEREWLTSNPIINVAVDASLAPLEFIDQNGNISGIAGSYLEKISNLLKVEFRWAGSNNWTEAIAAIHSNEADLLTIATPTDQRKEFLNFTDSYIDISYVILAREGEEIFGSMDSLAGKRISQVEGFAIADFIENGYPEVEIVYVSTAEDALRLVSVGEVDAFVGSLPLAMHTIVSKGLTNITVVGDTPYRAANAMAVRSDLPLLASALNKALRYIPEMEKSEISRTWLDIRQQEEMDYTLVWQIAAIAGIIVIMIMVRNYSLRKEVARRRVVEKQLKYLQERAENAQAEAEAANAAKSNFLANMSHEIRTPLNAIIGFSDAMLTGVGGEVKQQKHKEYLTDIRDSGEHLATVIKDILDLSKIEAGKWRLHESEFLLDECIREAMTMLKPQAEKKLVEIDYEPDLPVSGVKIFGDPVAIKRVFINLISNAIKFTSSDGLVTCFVNRLRNGRVSIEIADTGVGIPEDRLSHVLNPFEQCHGEHDLNEEGTGLGLPIVKNLVELHGGKFVLSSEMGVGTKATINFPTSRIVS